MRVLFVGDIVGKPGRQAFAALVPPVRRDRSIDLVVANGENAAGGAGLTGEIARELHDAGADIITNGNHVWDQRVFLKEIDTLDFCIRPLNLPPGNPGKGWVVHDGALVVNAIESSASPTVSVFLERSGERLCARIENRGNLPAEDPEKLFAPRSTAAGKNWGMGLARARLYAAGAGGVVRLGQQGDRVSAVLELPEESA